MSYKRKDYENYDCDRCKFAFKKKSLRLQKGLWVCSSCYDDISNEKKSYSMKLAGSPRSNSDTTTAVTSPTVFTITAAGGITPYHSLDSEVNRSCNLEVGATITFGSSYYMKIVGSGAINITADPQITAGSQGNIITLQGTSDSNSVLLENGTGVELSGGVSYTIGNNDVITLVYDSTKAKWVETSRQKNGGF